MKLVRSGFNTLRISLTPEDLKDLKVRLDDFDYDRPGGKKAIGALFEKAKSETGFDVEEEKVYIQLYPKNDGGCELFVIKLQEDDEKEFILFSNFEAFFAAQKLFSEKDGVRCYRFLNGEQYLIEAPLILLPHGIWEFGEKIKHAPSPLFLKTRCKEIFTGKETE